jgi:hypothetical protein
MQDVMQQDIVGSMSQISGTTMLSQMMGEVGCTEISINLLQFVKIL